MVKKARNVLEEVDTIKATRADSSRALAPLLVDEGMLTGDPAQCTLDVAKRALDIAHGFEERPDTVDPVSMFDLVCANGSQIGNQNAYLSHVLTTGGVAYTMTVALKEAHPTLDLPEPRVMYGAGLVHDLNAAFSDYSKGGQQSKELDLWMLAKSLGWERIANHVALHSDYIGAARLLASSSPLTNPAHEEAYSGMREVLAGDGPLSVSAIDREFGAFLEGRSNLPLVVLCVADFMEQGAPVFNPESVDADFRERTDDIFQRYFTNPTSKGKAPSLLGTALDQGGMSRMRGYKAIVSSLVRNDDALVARLRTETDFFKE